MDLGCVDMGCIEKEIQEISPQKESVIRSSSISSSDSVTATSKIGKNKGNKESNGQSSWNAFNKCTSQIRKPSHRKTSPLNWFPRKKVDSYLKRKIQLLQEVDGMNSTLDETLGDSSPHYSRVLREKIAVKEAASKAMEARKVAMVETSWCRILKAARIDCKDAEAQLVEAEKIATEAFEAATAIGVTMYDTPNVPKRSCKIESSAATHAVSASFETAFEVDKQVAYAVKTALTKLASCSSIKKGEFKELLRRISQNTDSDELADDVSGISSECDSDNGSECDEGVSERFNMANLEEMMLERLKCFQEDELASLATIVATFGLSAALAKEESVKKHDLGSRIPAPRRMSTFGGGSGRDPCSELPSLDKFLVKKLTRLEREVLEAKNARNGEARGYPKQQIPTVTNPSVPGLGDVLVKHSSKLEKEIENARKNDESSRTYNKKVLNIGGNCLNQDVAQLPSLDKFLVKHVSRLEREVQEAKKRRNGEQYEGCKGFGDRQPPTSLSFCDKDTSFGKENMNLNQKMDCKDSASLRCQCNTRNQQKCDIHAIAGFGSLDGLNNDRKQEPSPMRSHCKKLNQQKPDIHGNAGFGSLDSDNTVRMQESPPFRSHGNVLYQKPDMHGIAGFESPGCFDRMQQASSPFGTQCNMLNPQKGDIHGIAGFESSDSFNNDAQEESSSLRIQCNELSQQKRKIYGVAGLESSDCNKNDRVHESTPFGSHCNNLNPKKGDIHGIAGFEGSDSFSNDVVQEESSSSRIHSNKLSQQKHDMYGIAGLESSDCNKYDRVHESTAFGSHCNSLNPQKGDIHGIAGFGSLDKILVKRVPRLEREKREFLARERAETNVIRKTKKELESNEESLDQVLVKQKSLLEREKMAAADAPPLTEDQDVIMHSVSRFAARQKELQEAWGGSSLGDEKKHNSKLEREKMAAQLSENDHQEMHSVSRRDAKQKELQDAWRGMSLGNSTRPHLSRLQKEKAAWLQAEEEERKRA